LRIGNLYSGKTGIMLFRYKTLVIFSWLAMMVVFPVYGVLFHPNKLPLSGHFGRVVVEKGQSLVEIADSFKKAGLVESARQFIWTAKIMRVEKKLPAGIFVVPFGLSNYDLLKRLLYSGIYTENITVREGWTARKIADVLQEKCDIDSAKFIEAVENPEFIQQMGIEANSLEGYLFPETYNLYLGMDAYEVVRKMVVQFKSMFVDSLKYRAFALGFSVNEIITLASIIEGEVIYNSEAQIVSAVYHNRLRKRMLLQADPTIQYIIPDSPRRLHYSDLKIESPYNTYLNLGLPPGPIGNPGKRAILAALYPASSDYLYFVAKGDGYHYFNTTMEGHLSDKQKFNQYRRQVAMEKEDLNDKR